MSDRREAVGATEPTDPNDAHAALGLPKGVTLEPLDDDEPTEAEVAAACAAFAFEWSIHTYTDSLGDRDEGEAWHPSFEGAIYAALIAARKAGRE